MSEEQLKELREAYELDNHNYKHIQMYDNLPNQRAEEEIFRTEEQVREDVLRCNLPIRIRDIHNKEITKFDNYEDCVDFMQINWVTFERMLQGRTKYF